MKRLIYVLPVLLFFAIAGYFFWGLLAPDRNPSDVPSALLDKPVPSFTLPPLAGLDTPGLSRADFGGQVVVVNFFASWCVPCRAEHPLLLELTADPDIELVGIAYRDKPSDTTDWLRELGNPYARIGVDERGRTAIDWGVTGVPETFIVDQNGRIRYQHIGPIHPPELERKVRPLIESLKP